MVRWLTILALLIASTACNSTSIELAPAGLDVQQQLAELEALPAPDGVDAAGWQELKSALATYLVSTYPSGKIPAATTTSILAATQLSLDSVNDRLNWRFASPGDYDQNGEVNISDLTPLGANLGTGGGPFPFNSAQSVIDGDNNGEINISDITPIGANIGRQVLQYNVYCAPNAAGYPASNGAPRTIDPIGSVALGAATGNKLTDRLQFEFDVSGQPGGAAYWVRPSDGSDDGTPSNLVAPTFATVTVGASNSDNEGTSCSLAALANGNPAIAYRNETNADLKFAFSAEPDGSSGWTTLEVDSVGDLGIFLSLAVLANGNPAIAYYDNTNSDLKFAYSTQPDGSSGWNTLTIDTTNINGQYCSLAIINGFPAVSYYENNNVDLKYAYSAQVDGSADWTIITVDSLGFVGQHTSLAQINGFPAISYFDETNQDLKYAFSSKPDGSSGWSTLTVDATGNTGYWTSLAEVNGFPAISYKDHNTFGLNYSFSSQPDGSSGWTRVSVDDENDAGQYCSLAVIGGKPAISYFNATFGRLKYAVSSADNGSGGWSSMVVAEPGGQYCSLAEIDGKPGIAFYNTPDTSLGFAWLQ